MPLLPRTQVLGQLAGHPTCSFQLQNLLTAIGSHSRPPFPWHHGTLTAPPLGSALQSGCHKCPQGNLANVHLLEHLGHPCLARVKGGLESCFAFHWPQPVSPQALRARLVFNDFLSCFVSSISSFSLASFGPARGVALVILLLKKPLITARGACRGISCQCSVTDQGSVLGRGNPACLTLPWNLYYIERQQLSSGGFGSVQCVSLEIHLRWASL